MSFVNDHIVTLARQSPPMSTGDLFRFCFGKDLEKYGVSEKEYIRMIHQEVVRLRRTAADCQTLIKCQTRELDRLRQELLPF